MRICPNLSVGFGNMPWKRTPRRKDGVGSVTFGSCRRQEIEQELIYLKGLF
jgi:hypothetical protein